MKKKDIHVVEESQARPFLQIHDRISLTRRRGQFA